MPSLSTTLGAEQVVEIDSHDREEVLRALVDLVARDASENGGMADSLLTAVLERERLASTGFGDGVAMPHIRVDGISRHHTVLGRTQHGVEFDAADQQPVHLLLLIVGPASEKQVYQKLMGRAARFLKEEGSRLQSCADLAATVVELVTDY